MLKAKKFIGAVSLGLAMAGLVAGSAAADLDKRLMRTNVECGGSYVTGFTVIRSEVDQYIGEAAAIACGDAADIARYTVVPASVDMFDLGEVLAYLEAQGETQVAPVLQGKDTERRLVDGVVVVTTSRPVNGGW